MATRENHFHVADFVVFGVTVFISIGIGIYYALSGGKQKTTSEYLLGGRIINFIPVAISLMVTFESSIMMLGLPAEGYFHGIQYVMNTIGGTFSHILAAYLVVPLMHPLKITTAYQYLEYRFNSKAVRVLGTIFGMFFYIWYMGIVLFGPATALEAVTGFPLWTSIITISTVSVVYTSIGGLKAVVWTDVFQAMVMFCGIFAVLIKGTIDVGGPKQVWDIANEGGRLNFFEIDPDPMLRMSFWSLTIGTVFRFIGFSFNQSTIQRISSTRSEKDARRVIWIVTPCFAFVTCIGMYEGIVAYAYYQTKQCDPYESKQISNQNQVPNNVTPTSLNRSFIRNRVIWIVTPCFAFVTCIGMYEGIVAYAYYQTKQCDPYESKQISNQNQLLPYMVMEMFKDTPGMPGLFLASLFSASLSTLSSGLSSLSAMLWTDIVHPLVGDISDFKATLIAKLSVLLFGVIACGLAFLVSLIGGIIHQIATIILVAFSSPVAGMFLLGCFSPRVTAKGVMIGGITSFILTAWISFGMNFSPTVRPSPLLPPASTAQCFVGDSITNTSAPHPWRGHTYVETNVTVGVMESTTIPGVSEHTESPPLHGVEILYNVSYMWLAVISVNTTLLVGYLASLITGANKPGDVDPRYLLDVSKSVLFCCPSRLQNWLSSFGTQFNKDEYEENFPDPALTKRLLDHEAIVLSPAKSESSHEHVNDQTTTDKHLDV